MVQKRNLRRSSNIQDLRKAGKLKSRVFGLLSRPGTNIKDLFRRGVSDLTGFAFDQSKNPFIRSMNELGERMKKK